MIKYTVREIANNAITVDYANGAWARVPLQSGWSKEQIHDVIEQYAPKPIFDSIEDVPFTVGEVGTAKTADEKTAEYQAEYGTQLMGYRELRAAAYPNIGDQFDALYWARQGDNTKLAEIDAKIQQIKADFPKDMAPITRAEHQAIIDAASE